MTLQEEFEQQYERLNALTEGYMLNRRLADAYSEPRETRAYRWFVRGRSFGMPREQAESQSDRACFDAPWISCEPDDCIVDGHINKQDWIAIGSLMGWIPEKEK